MKVYLAAAFARKLEIRERAQELNAKGIEVTATWIYEAHDKDTDATPLYLAAGARKNLGEINEADVFVCFTEPHNNTKHSSGGRHVEMGWAMAKDKRVMSVGPLENVFHYLVDVENYVSWGDCLAELVAAHQRFGAKR